MKRNEMTYRIEPVNQAVANVFDIDSWLADLLVDYWLAKGDGGNDCGPPPP